MPGQPVYADTGRYMSIRAGLCRYGQVYVNKGRYMSIRASVSSLQMQESISIRAAGRLYAVRFFCPQTDL